MKETITPELMSTIAVGAIFVTTGGYDANFADFFKVVGKTAKSLKVVQIGKKLVTPGKDCMNYGSVAADPDTLKSQPKTLRVRAYSWGDKPTVVFNTQTFGSIGRSAHIWDGNPIHEYNHH